MLHFLLIVLDDDLNRPVYAEPNPEDLDSDLWERVGQIIVDVTESELKPIGDVTFGEAIVAWRSIPRNGITFLAVVEDVGISDVRTYLKDLVTVYFDEVDDVRKPERDGVQDIVVDVIPPWDD